VLSTSRQLEFAKGSNEVIMGALLIRQLHVSRPDHHQHVHSSFFCRFGLCNNSEYRSKRLHMSFKLFLHLEKKAKFKSPLRKLQLQDKQKAIFLPNKHQRSENAV